MSAQPLSSSRGRPAIVVHGGAWAIPDQLTEACRAGTQTAAIAGYKLLTAGGTAVDAVEAAVRALEDDWTFDAGHGSVLNARGAVEMDAMIMDGSSLRAGSVACVRNIANPVTLARAVMEQTEHTMLVGSGANEFAAEQGIQTVPQESLISQEARDEFNKMTHYTSTVDSVFKSRVSVNCGHDTVGAVALDSGGNLACATSTGGITRKRPGRVGDSPLIGECLVREAGSGGYADNDVGAVSTTGHGESMTKVCLASTVLHNISLGRSSQEAVEEALSYMSRRVDGSGGAIVLDRAGNVGVHFTTERMTWAAVTEEGEVHHGVEPGEDTVTAA